MEPRTILGVEGIAPQTHEWPNGLYSSQTWKASRDRGNQRLTVELRFDDDCRNGHQTFAITAELRDTTKHGDRGWLAGGMMHDAIPQWFPELAPLIRWHRVSTDGPMHYIANTVWHAGDRDHRGLRKGERRQLRNGKTGVPCWRVVQVDSAGIESPMKDPGIVESESEPATALPTLAWRPYWIHGGGKERDLNAARSCAVWPEATDAELSAEPEALTQALRARLPTLIADFRHAMTDTCGFDWREVAK